MEKLYNFLLTINEAKIIIDALKDRPMKNVEGIVIKMDKQFSEQYVPEVPPVVEEPPVTTKKGKKNASNSNTTSSANS